MTDAAVQEQEKPDVQTPAAPPPAESQQLVRSSTASTIGFGMSARNWDEGFRIAKVLAASELVPKTYQQKPENIVVAMQHGAEIGLPPMAALQSIAVINGKPGVYGDGFLGVIMSTAAYQKHREYYRVAGGEVVKSLRQQDYADDETTAVSEFWRRGNPEPFVGEFSIGDAKRAKLWGKEGPWSTAPGRMLKWRARGFAGRDGFAAELRGIRTAEELHDSPEDEIIVEALSTSPPPEPVRRSEKVAAAPASADAAAPDPTPLGQGYQPTDDVKTDPPPTSGTAVVQPPPAAESGTRPAATARQTTKAAAATKPAPSQFAQAAPATSTPNMVITNTGMVTPKGLNPFYEITARREEKGQVPVAFIFATEDEGIYKMASSCEGSDTKFTLTWHSAKRHDGSTCKVLDAIEAAN